MTSTTSTVRRAALALSALTAAALLAGCGAATVPVQPAAPGTTEASAGGPTSEPAGGPDTVEVDGVPVQVPPGLGLPDGVVVDVATPGMVTFSSPTGRSGLDEFAAAFESAGYTIDTHTGSSFVFAAGEGDERWAGDVISDGSGIVLTYRQGASEQATAEATSTAVAERIEADGRTVAVPPGFRLPEGVVIAEHGDNFIKVSEPRGADALDFYRQMLPGAGYTVDADDGSKIAFSNVDWYGNVAVLSDEVTITFDVN